METEELYEPDRQRLGVIERPWDMFRALLDLPEGTAFERAYRGKDGILCIVVSHPRLAAVDPNGPLPRVEPGWRQPNEPSFKGWVEVG